MYVYMYVCMYEWMKWTVNGSMYGFALNSLSPLVCMLNVCMYICMYVCMYERIYMLNVSCSGRNFICYWCVYILYMYLVCLYVPKYMYSMYVCTLCMYVRMCVCTLCMYVCVCRLVKYHIPVPYGTSGPFGLIFCYHLAW